MKKTQVAKSMLNPWSNIFSNWVLTWINHGVNIFKTHGCFFSYLTHEKNGVQAQAGGIVYVTGRSSPGKESAGKPREGVDKNPGKVMVSLGKWSTNGGFPHPIWNHIYIICIICHIYDIYIYIYIMYIYMYIVYVYYTGVYVCSFLAGSVSRHLKKGISWRFSPFNEFGKFDEFGPRWRSNSMGPFQRVIPAHYE